MGHARLTTRRLISISGIDAPHFLQGLTTTSIEGEGIGNGNANGNGRSAERSQHWYYCGFLNALGRVLHDVFIYPIPSTSEGIEGAGSGQGPHFLIEVDATQATALLKHLKRYKLRSKIALRAVDEDEMSVWQVWDDGNASASGISTTACTSMLQMDSNGTITVPDLRAPRMGYRVLSRGTDLDIDTLALNFTPSFSQQQQQQQQNQRTDETAYRIRRYLLGVAEGSAEIVPAQALPQESNMDLMGGIDFRKGCYVGQELTIRTRHRGVVRKRILPCVLYGEGEPVPEVLQYDPSATPPTYAGNGGSGNGSGSNGGDNLKSLTIGRYGKKGRSTGTFLSGIGNLGLALCRVQLMTDLVVPNDTATSDYDPAAEFVIQPGKDKDTDRADGEQDRDAEMTRVVKVKAFVPDWLRQRLGENTVKHGH
jgi:transferase CAF17, mitochondrial